MNTRVGQMLCARHSGKHSTGVESFNLHAVLCTCVCAKSLQSRLTLCDPVDRSPPGPSVHGILQARILEWVDMSSSRGSSRSGDRTASPKSPTLAGRVFTTSAILCISSNYCHRSAKVLLILEKNELDPSGLGAQASLVAQQ